MVVGIEDRCGPLLTALPLSLVGLGVSAAFAVKLFKSWLNERDINSVAASLRKVGMDNRLMVRIQMQILRACVSMPNK